MSKWQTCRKYVYELHGSPLFICPKKYAIFFILSACWLDCLLTALPLILCSFANLYLVSPAFAYAFHMRQFPPLISTYYISHDIRKRFLYRLPLSPRPRPVQMLCFFLNANILTDTSLAACESVCMCVLFPAAPDVFVCAAQPKKYANKNKEKRTRKEKTTQHVARGPIS